MKSFKQLINCDKTQNEMNVFLHLEPEENDSDNDSEEDMQMLEQKIFFFKPMKGLDEKLPKSYNKAQDFSVLPSFNSTTENFNKYF